MILFLLRKYWLHLAIGAAIVAGVLVGIGYIYYLGSRSGEAKIQSLWTKDIVARTAEIEKIKIKIGKDEISHRNEIQRISDDLIKSDKKHALALAAVQSEYTNRLRLSESRASAYKHLSEGGSTERDYLANHAAKLDSSLEEGRSLVRELRETLGLRDSQIINLSEIIKNDQRLFQR